MLTNRLIFCVCVCVWGSRLVGTNFSVVYVANPNASDVKSINASDDNGDLISAQLYAGDGRESGNIVVLPDGTRAFFSREFVSGNGNIDIREYDVVNNANDNLTSQIIPLTGILRAHALAATNDKVFVAEMNQFDKDLLYIDTSTFSVATITSNVGGQIYDMVVANGKLYISIAGGIKVYNATTNAFVATVSGMTSTFTGIAASPDGTRVYVIDDTNKQLRAIETTNNTEVTTGGFPASITSTSYAKGVTIGSTSNISFPAGVGVVDISDSLTKIYVCEPDNDRINVLNAATGEHVTYITVGDQPMRIAIADGRNRGYVSNHNSGNVSFLNLVTDSKIEDITIGGKPLGIAFRQGNDSPTTPVVSIANSMAVFVNGLTNLLTLLATNADGTLLSFTVSGVTGTVTQPISDGSSQEATFAYAASGRAQSTSFIFKATNAGVDSNTVTVTLVPLLDLPDIAVN